MLSVLADRAVELDVLDEAGRRRVLEQVRPDVVVNAVGVVKQAPEVADTCATARSTPCSRTCSRSSATQCRRAARARQHRLRLLGQAGRYGETDVPDPVDFYGRSKLRRRGGRRPAPDPADLHHRPRAHAALRRCSTGSWRRTARVVRGFDRAIYSGVHHGGVRPPPARGGPAAPRASPGSTTWPPPPSTKYDLLQLVADEYGWTGEIVPDEDFACDRSMTRRPPGRRHGYRPPHVARDDQRDADGPKRPGAWKEREAR